jgi:hypothetical protein
MVNQLANEETRRTKTTTIGGGVEYAKVADRLLEFHEDVSECSIETTVEFKEGWVLAGAKVSSPRGVFTGHSLGEAKGKKALEKMETIAVGRALAFAGYAASGDIASFEEMEMFRQGQSSGNTGDDAVFNAMMDKIRQVRSKADYESLGKKIQTMADDRTVSREVGQKLLDELFVEAGDFA